MIEGYLFCWLYFSKIHSKEKKEKKEKELLATSVQSSLYISISAGHLS